MKSIRKSIGVLLVMVLTSTLFLAGCSGTKDTADNVTPTGTGSTQGQTGDKEEQKPVTLKVMTLWAEDNKENIATGVRAALDKFKADNPNITIEEESIGDQTAYYTKIKALAASNSLPDVFVCKGSELSTFAQNGLVASLDDILNTDTQWKGGFLASSFDDLTTAGKIYGVPYSMLSTHVIYYNKQILADAGYDTFPTTWDDFTAMVKKIKDKGITPIALGNKEQWVAESCILSALGDRFTGTEWFNSIKDNKGASFNDEGFVKSLAALQELGKIGAFNNDMNSINNDQQKTLYFNKKAAMFMEGSWAVGAVVAGPKDVADNTEVAVLPSVNGQVGEVLATSGGAGSGFAVGIKNYEEKKEAIASLLKAISGEEYSKIIAAKGEPVAYQVTDYDKSNVSALAVKYSELASKLKFTPIYDSYLDPAVIQVMNSGLQELLIGEVTPEKLAKDIQAEYKKIYK